jgi:hypothetical protein
MGKIEIDIIGGENLRRERSVREGVVEIIYKELEIPARDRPITKSFTVT